MHELKPLTRRLSRAIPLGSWFGRTGRLRVLGAALAMALACVSLTACGASKPVADVVGLALDDAHNQLKAAGFKKFKDVDAFEDRSIFRDANWVVLEQSPEAGTATKLGSKITLTVGKKDEERALSQLPGSSPVLIAANAAQREAEAKAAAKAAEEAAKERAEAAAAAEAAKDYVDDIDSLIRLVNSAYGELDKTGRGVKKETYGPFATEVASAARGTMEAVVLRLAAEEPPGAADKDEPFDTLQQAADRFVNAAGTLVAATFGARASNLAKFREVIDEAGDQWNAALEDLYSGTGEKAPLLK